MFMLYGLVVQMADDQFHYWPPEQQQQQRLASLKVHPFRLLLPSALRYGTVRGKKSAAEENNNFKRFRGMFAATATTYEVLVISNRLYKLEQL